MGFLLQLWPAYPGSHERDMAGAKTFAVSCEVIQNLSPGMQSVDPARLALQFWRALAIGQNDWIVAPSGLQVSLDLFLARPSPGSARQTLAAYRGQIDHGC